MGTLIFYNEQNHKRDILNLERVGKIYQDAVGLFNAIGIEGKPLATEDLYAMFEDPKGFLYNKLTKGEGIKVGGHSLIPSKGYDMIQTPAGCNAFITYAMKVQSDLKMGSDKNNFPHIQDVKQFTIDETGRVIIAPALSQSISDTHHHYTQNDKQEAEYSDLKTICDIANAHFGKSHTLTVERLLRWLEDSLITRGEEIVPDHDTIKRIRESM